MTDQTSTLSHRWVAGLASTSVKAVLIGAAVGVVFGLAPVTSADPAPSTQQEPADNQQEQQDEQQQKGFSPPRPDAPDNNPSNNNPSNNNPPNNPTNNDASKKGDLADKNCWMYSTGPEWFAPGAMPRPGLPGEKVWPCYYVAGLTPH
ncbi:hypothetical protein [Mycolicibacter heraklionensis]|uniref:hypothetical protein n=1 Tax=Mycolicibacter heraklionensis TaxID=512402 RepID=UPI0007EA1C69|nr:hypothetical protein [Mycolicibacter heraklionensis]OBG39271.1 hypothetical protein A5671_16425 [Mycolicibacter heraklionensis]